MSSGHCCSVSHEKSRRIKITFQPDRWVGITNDVWVSTQFLRKIEEDLLGKQSDKNTKGEFSANKYLSKLFGEFTNLTGGAMDLAITTDPKDDKLF
jgi:hypothetical protein